MKVSQHMLMCRFNASIVNQELALGFESNILNVPVQRKAYRNSPIS